MKKFTSIAVAMFMTGFGFMANAQDLGEGTAVVQTNIGSPMMPTYVTNLAPNYVSTLPTVGFVWGENINSPTGISLVDPQQSNSMIPGMGPTNYAPAYVTLPTGGDPVTIQATLNSPTNTMLNVNLLSVAVAGYGEYTVTIPANTVKNAGEATNTETVYKVNYLQSGAVTISPSESQLAPQDFKGATISFNGEFKEFIDEEAVVVRLIDYNNPFAPPVKAFTSSDINVSEDKSSLSVSFDGINFANGEKYQIQVVANTFIYTSEDKSYLNGSASSLSLLFDGLKEAEVIDGPAYYTAPGFRPITLTWDWQNINAVEEDITVVASFENASYETEYLEIPSSAVKLAYITKPEEGGEVAPQSNDNNVLVIDISEYIPEDAYGHPVKVILPEGAIANEAGKVNQQTVVDFVVYPLTDCEVIFEQESDGFYYLNWVIMNDLSTMNLNYYGPYEMYLLNSDGDKAATIYNDPYGMYGYPQPGAFWLSGYSMLNGQPTEIYVDVEGNELPDGVYNLYVPESLVLLNVNGEFYLNSAYYSEEIIFGTGSSVVKELDKDSKVEGYVVYNLKGVKVIESNTSDALNSLDSGIYVINGKKVLIRK